MLDLEMVSAVSELQDRLRRRQQRLLHRPGCGCRPGRHQGRQGDQQLLRRQRVPRRGHGRVALSPRRDRHHRELGRQRLRVSFPAASQYVTAVGGTHLVKDGSARGWTETTWSGAGSGCSLFIAKPSWQTDPGCNKRTVADVSAVADPATGVAVYDSFGSSGGANWFVFGGTSVSAPIVGTVYALSGNTSAVPAQLAWTNPSALNDVVSGSNGVCLPTASYLCTAGTGYDGPTGNGTPKGLSAF